MKGFRWVVFPDDGHQELRKKGGNARLATLHRLSFPTVGIYLRGELVGRVAIPAGDSWDLARSIAEGEVAKLELEFKPERGSR
jgi:hypothetical protein